MIGRDSKSSTNGAYLTLTQAKIEMKSHPTLGVQQKFLSSKHERRSAISPAEHDLEDTFSRNPGNSPMSQS